MRKKAGRFVKFHKKNKKHLLFAGVPALIIGVVLSAAVFLGFYAESRAEGYMTVENGDTQGTFWYGYTIPRDLKLWQELKVTTNTDQTYTYGDSSDTDDFKTQTVAIPYSREGNFKLQINTQKIRSNNSGLGDDLQTIDSNVKWKDSSNTESYFSWISQYATSYNYTYYRVVKKGESVGKDWGAELMAYYRGYYVATNGNKVSSDDIVQSKDSCGRDFYNMANTYLKSQGFSVYSSDSNIPLTQNGEEIAGVEMVSFISRDFYYNVVRGSESSKRVDLDVMLYTSHNYKFNYSTKAEELKAPTLTTESKTDISEKISEDDAVILEDVNPAGTAKVQYCLSDIEVTDTSRISWQVYNEPVRVNGKKYLYVRSTYADGSKNYIESDAVPYELEYMDSSSAIAKSTPENGTNVDVGDKIELTQGGAAADAALFYVVDAANAPTLTRVEYADRQKLLLDNHTSDGKYVKLNDVVYIKMNGIWYSSSDNSLQKYTVPITTDESLRVKNTVAIHVLVEENGRELGEFQTLRFTYGTTQQTEAPQSDIPTSSASPATVDMGKQIRLMCSTSGSRIFYTTNGSAPVINETENGPVAGENTEEYDDSKPIVVNEKIANYGESFLIMAQAVTYIQIDENYYRSHQDSPVAKFGYIVSNQAMAESVQSIPATSAETPTEVQIGSKIQLYSNTEDVTIYYTLDGSEPVFDASTGERGENTYLYSGAEGIEITKATDSSLFTITAVAYKTDMAVSEISRLVFAYPGGVSSPYANPAEGAVTENTAVTLKTATEGAVIYYEIAHGDDTPNEPTTSSKVFDETNPILITRKTTIKAFAVKKSMESTVVTITYNVSDKLKVPVPSIDTGSVVASGTVISLEADSGATIYYTTDGSDPKDSANKKVQVGNNVVVNGKGGDMIILRTYAAKTGYSNSEAGTYSYTVSAYDGGIYADKESGGIVKNGETITLHTDMSDAEIYYTTDGSTPTEEGHSGSQVTVYGEPGEQITIMAMAVAKGSEQSTTFATFTYTIMEKVAAPTSSVPDGAIFTKESMIELKAEAGRIYYTTDGSDPTTSSNLYKKSIVIDKAVTIKAIAVADDLETSDISTFNYGFASQVAAPIASYASGELEMGTKVAFTSATEGATIYYRTDGKDINLSRKNELEIYKEPITINQATNFKVIAVKDKMQDSNVLKVGYTVKEPVVIEAVDEEEVLRVDNQSNRLQSRRSFSDTESGPSYKDVVLRNASYGAIVAAEEGTIPDQVQLVVEAANVTEAVNRRVKQVISDSFGVVASYDVTLLVNGEETQPEGTIEIGLPIPVEYENAMIHIVHVAEDGNIELFETRRSGGVAYAKVDHLSVFSITAPVEFAEEASTFPWLPVMYTLAVGLTGIGIWLIYKAKKQRREEGMQDV